MLRCKLGNITQVVYVKNRNLGAWVTRNNGSCSYQSGKEPVQVDSIAPPKYSIYDALRDASRCKEKKAQTWFLALECSEPLSCDQFATTLEVTEAGPWKSH